MILPLEDYIETLDRTCHILSKLLFAMDEITNPKQFSDIPDGDYILLTKLTNPDLHEQKDDRLHKSTDKETWEKYKDHRCPKCEN